MHSMRRTLAMMGLLVLVVGLTGLGAQEPASTEGQLLRVDPDAMTLAIQASDGSEQEFAFTEETQVTGAEGGVAGLATMSGQTVVIQYENGDPPTATAIEVQN